MMNGVRFRSMVLVRGAGCRKRMWVRSHVHMLFLFVNRPTNPTQVCESLVNTLANGFGVDAGTPPEPDDACISNHGAGNRPTSDT